MSNLREELPGIEQFRIPDQWGVVTGGSKGLGWAIASGLASAGANLLLVSRHADEVQEKAKLLRENFGVKAEGFQADVTDVDQVDALREYCLGRCGVPSILVNNAGINIRGPIDELSYEDFQRVMRTNVEGPWLVTRALIPTMKEQRYGRIINVASTLGLVGLANRTPYTSSKGAIVQLTRAMALEFAPWNINCNAICPGPFLTEMNIPISQTADAKTNIVGATAINRWGELREIQGAAIFLSSPASSFTTGSMIVVDGGWTAR
jgi:NAD(P)-dependent dehydrogenase (short-subunit alcohol dehydrogenase family)